MHGWSRSVTGTLRGPIVLRVTSAGRAGSRADVAPWTVVRRTTELGGLLHELVTTNPSDLNRSQSRGRCTTFTQTGRYFAAPHYSE